MKILVTGAKGFVGKNLIIELRNRGYKDILEYDIDSDAAVLDQYTQECGFVYHLAGVNRPKDEKEFMEGNFGFTSTLLDSLQRHGNKATILITSSIHAGGGNAYGISKKAGEDLVFLYGRNNYVKTLVYRLPNLFGKWCRPNYNSAVATFCSNIANGLPITVNDPNIEMNLVYIDDLVDEFIGALEGKEHKRSNFCYVETVHTVKLGQIAALIHSFRDSRECRTVPDMSDPFTKKLYSTYLSYLPNDKLFYPLNMNVDNRGSFTEFLKTNDRGQVSINISKPGITKGNHWHHTKNEKFLVVSGRGVIRLRQIDNGEVVEYHVSGDKLEVIDIPSGYTHNITNIGNTDMVTVMWANEPFDPAKPDTYFLEV